MHEMGIALEVYRVCRETVEQHGGGRLHAVRMAIGELAAVEPDLLSFAWEAVVHDGPDAGARLEVTWCPAEQHCAQCGEKVGRSEGSWLRLCPDCGMPLTVRGGNELDVLDVVIESGEETTAAVSDEPQPSEEAGS
jgi:hydrogenase nickel incorporation protein HypA/HybF